MQFTWQFESYILKYKTGDRKICWNIGIWPSSLTGHLSCPSPLHLRFLCLSPSKESLLFLTGESLPSLMCVPTAGDGCVQGFCYLHAARVKWINGLAIWAAVKGPWLEESFQSGKQAQWCDEIREAVTFSDCSERVGWHGASEKISANTEMTRFATFIKIFSYLLGDAFSLVCNASGCTSFQYIF